MADDIPSEAECLAKVNAILADSVAAGVPGLSAAISSSDKQWTFTAGVSHIQPEQPVVTSNLFGIGSITKVFVAVVILQLVEEKKLHLDDTVGQHLGEDVYQGVDDVHDATIARLLSHEAGIDSWEDDSTWIQHGRGSKLDPSHIWTKTEPLDYIRRPKITAPDPGRWYYSNTNYTLLGLVIEKVTNNTAEAEIRRRILQPLELQHTFLEGFELSSLGAVSGRYHFATSTFRDSAGVCPSFPNVRKGLIDCSPSNLSVEWTAGGMVCSASDLVKFALALREGRLLGPESFAIMTEWRPTTGPTEMGHGLFRMKSPESEDKWLGHNGGVLGFTSCLWWAEKGDCVVSVMSNVGVMHSGDVPSSAGHVLAKTEFLELASQLART